MKCFVKITERYAEEASRYGCSHVVNRFKKEVENHENYQHNQRDVYGFGNFLRREHKNFRSVFEFKRFKIKNEEVCCYVALRVFKRGDQEYDNFIMIISLSRNERT